jgi:NAD(P)-dependent dehydrogenase (short-subunit alcohol dehydrogenase family)
MSWTTHDIPDQTGRVAVVTGANGGLGLETTRALAMAGSHVIMAVRDQEKAVAALTEIQRLGAADGSLELVGLDLGSQASVREAAGQISATHEAVDILVNNAGVMAIPEHRTGDGFEMQFAVNHLGHYALTALLLPVLLRARASIPPTRTCTAATDPGEHTINPSSPISISA